MNSMVSVMPKAGAIVDGAKPYGAKVSANRVMVEARTRSAALNVVCQSPAASGSAPRRSPPG